MTEKVRMGQRRLRKSGRDSGSDLGETGVPCQMAASIPRSPVSAGSNDAGKWSQG